VVPPPSPGDVDEMVSLVVVQLEHCDVVVQPKSVLVVEQPLSQLTVSVMQCAQVVPVQPVLVQPV
jgi:hypothetical protein